MTVHEQEVLIEKLEAEWVGGGAATPLVAELIRLKRLNRAGAIARLALAAEVCQDRATLEKLLQRTGNPPRGWENAVAAFHRNPTLENWDSLMYFTPLPLLYQRTRNTLRVLRRVGTDPDVLFMCATRNGTVPDAFELVQSGDVAPETVVQRALEAPPGLQAMWLGLAAEAAFARGDMLGVVRLLKRACAETVDCMTGPEMSINAIRAAASDELHHMLDSVGIPRCE